MTRRSSLPLLGKAAALPLLASAARAQDNSTLTIRGGQFRPVSIAVTTFQGDGDLGAKLTAVILNNFNRSVFLAPIDPRSFPETIDDPDQPPGFDAWKTVNAQYVVTGRSGRSGDGRLQTDFRLWDVSTGEQAAGQEYVTDPNNARRVAHLVSDAVFSRITGEKGCFDSRVVFVDETGPAERRRKRLAIMDQDGANVRYLTRGEDLVVTPRFSPT